MRMFGRPANTLYDYPPFSYARRIFILVVIPLPYRILDISYHLLILIFLAYIYSTNIVGGTLHTRAKKAPEM